MILIQTFGHENYPGKNMCTVIALSLKKITFVPQAALKARGANSRLYSN